MFKFLVPLLRRIMMTDAAPVVAAVVAKVAKPRISNEDFVRDYDSCVSYDELAKLTGLTKASVAARAGKLRKLGVNLEPYDRQKAEVNVEALNALLSK
jgi:hypothetical protein